MVYYHISFVLMEPLLVYTDTQEPIHVIWIVDGTTVMPKYGNPFGVEPNRRLC